MEISMWAVINDKTRRLHRGPYVCDSGRLTITAKNRKVTWVSSVFEKSDFFDPRLLSLE